MKKKVAKKKNKSAPKSPARERLEKRLKGRSNPRLNAIAKKGHDPATQAAQLAHLEHNGPPHDPTTQAALDHLGHNDDFIVCKNMRGPFPKYDAIGRQMEVLNAQSTSPTNNGRWSGIRSGMARLWLLLKSKFVSKR